MKDRSIKNHGVEAPAAQTEVTDRMYKQLGTMCGVVTKDAVILGNDTRNTAKCEKTHFIAPHIRGVGTGTVLPAITSMKSNMGMNRQVPVMDCIKMLEQYFYQYQMHAGAELIVGGVDSTGVKLYSVSSRSNSDQRPFLAIGSGSSSAITILESQWKPDLTPEEGMRLVRDAVSSGIFNDSSSGGCVELWLITKEGQKFSREIPNKRLGLGTMYSG
ncbi:uncharacterized protein LOC136035559 [Artemia franciscana]|uniref:uncharacterized protein LOC136035559 n=1 Tax=Artemia franciscana TaxID=6661 RepID=UPI0032DA75F1